MTVTFRDDFSKIDPNRWGQSFHPPSGQSNHLYDGKIEIVNNQLVMHANKTPDGVYHLSSIDTKPKIGKAGFVQRYGIFTVRAKAPAGKGAWGAPLWMYANASGWAEEIDVSETLGSYPTKDERHIHWINNGVAGEGFIAPFDLTQDFHLYKAVWRPGYVKFYLDGRLVWTYTGTHVPQHALPLIMDVSVGGPLQAWAGSPGTTFDTKMIIDYVQVEA